MPAPQPSGVMQRYENIATMQYAGLTFSDGVLHADFSFTPDYQ